jgi:hypothetical protein
VEPDLLILLGKAFSELALYRSDYLVMLVVGMTAQSLKAGRQAIQSQR